MGKLRSEPISFTCCREELDASPTILRYLARTATTEQYLYGRDALAAVQVRGGQPVSHV